MKAKKIADSKIDQKVNELNGWKYKKTAIEKNFVFTDFRTAFSFLTSVALLSEKMDHHAEWRAVYNKVALKLSTHEAGGLTQKDIDMAKEIDNF